MRLTFVAVVRACYGVALLGLLACTDQSNPPAHDIHYTAQVVNPHYTGAMVEPQTQALLVWGSDGTIRRSSNGDDWEFIATPTTAQINRIRASQHNILIAIGDQGTLLRSDNQGKNWTEISVNTTANLKTLLYSETHQRWFAGGTGGTLLSADATALRWEKTSLGKGLDMLDIDTLFVSPHSQRLLLGGSRGLLGVSDDGGASWQVMQLDLDTPLSGFYHVDNVLLATSAHGKILVSRDDGNSWQLIETDGQAFFHDGVADKKHNAFVLVSHNGKVLRTADQAETWQLISTPFHGIANYLASIIFDAHDNSLRAFGHYGTQLVSRDGGVNWESQPHHEHIVFDDVLPAATGKHYIGYGRGGLLATSRDRGGQWQLHQTQLDIYWRQVLVTSQGTWLAAGELGYLLRSADKGHSWQLLDVAYTNPSTPPTYRALIQEPQSNALLAAGPTGTIVRSVDDGKTWREVHHTPFDDAEAFTDLLFDPQHQRLIAVEADGRHYVSHDQGQHWTVSALPTQRKFWHGVVLNEKNHSVAIIAGQGGVAARSTDGGETWELLETHSTADVFGSYADQQNKQLFLLGAKGALLRSQDDGKNWHAISVSVDADLRRMIQHPPTGALLAFGGDGVMLRSTDRGHTWAAIETGATQELREAVIEPATQDIIVTGRAGKVLRSQDGGLHWQLLPTHTASHFRSLTVDPTSASVIAVGERLVRIAPIAK